MQSAKKGHARALKSKRSPSARSRFRAARFPALPRPFVRRRASLRLALSGGGARPAPPARTARIAPYGRGSPPAAFAALRGGRAFLPASPPPPVPPLVARGARTRRQLTKRQSGPKIDRSAAPPVATRYVSAALPRGGRGLSAHCGGVTRRRPPSACRAAAALRFAARPSAMGSLGAPSSAVSRRRSLRSLLRFASLRSLAPLAPVRGALCSLRSLAPRGSASLAFL